MTRAYEQATALGFNEFQLGNYAEARARFMEAHNLFPNARTLRALGMAEYELKNYGEAIVALEQALASAVRPLEGPARASTEELIERAKGYVARVILDVEPATATIVVDGSLVQLQAGRVLRLNIGDHSVEVRAQGHVPEHRRVTIALGDEHRIHFRLIPVVDPKDRKEERAIYKNPWLWTAVGVAALGLGFGLGFGLRDGAGTAEPQGGATGISLEGPR